MRDEEPAARAFQAPTKASTSSGVGGKPVRSNVARRISTRFSAGGAGCKPFCSNAARMNSSIGDLIQATCFTVGSGGFAGG